MRVIVVGMGEVGRHVAKVLVAESHDVILIDHDAQVLAAAEEQLDAMTLLGHGAATKTLKQSNIASCDLFIAVTNACEVNLLSCIRAKAMGAKKTIARVAQLQYLDDERAVFQGLFGIDVVINPDALVALEMHRIVRSANAIAIEDFADNRIEMIQLPVTDEPFIVHRQLKDVKMPENTLIAAILRDDEIVVPSGIDIVLPGDEVFIVGKIEQIGKIEKLFERERRHFTRRVMIIGGSKIGRRLAQALARDGIEVTLFERERERARELAEMLDQVVVIQGDGTDIDLLREESVERVDAFVSVSGDDEINVMASLVAKDLGAPRVIATVFRPDYSSVCSHLGIDATLSPRLEVAKQVLKHVRVGEVTGITPILEGRAEFLEFVVPEKARIANRPIREIDFPRAANICAVTNAERAYVPRGEDEIKPGDRVVVFATPALRGAVERMFRPPRFMLGT